jgi:hypothetical protein
MRFLDFPNWVQYLSLAVDFDRLGDILLILSIIHIIMIIYVIKKTPGIFCKVILCSMLLELPAVTVFLLYVAGLPKA